MSRPDYYSILGVPSTATADEIKQSYRRLASKYHPDKFSVESSEKTVAETKFKEAKEAYETLSDADKRREYDNPAPKFNKDDFASAFGDIFRHNPEFHDIFNRHTEQPRTEINVITISLQDAYIGRTITVNSNIVFHLPKGIRSGTKLFNNGKLYRIDVKPDEKFKRSNDDLLMDVSITAIEAMLGIEATFDHLDGVRLQFNIPAGMQSGQIVKLGKKGMKNPETDQYGDLLVRVAITIPKSLTSEEKDILKSLQHRTTIIL